jgi:hypothetical protein
LNTPSRAIVATIHLVHKLKYFKQRFKFPEFLELIHHDIETIICALFYPKNPPAAAAEKQN